MPVASGFVRSCRSGWEMGSMAGVELPEVPIQNPEGGRIVEEPKGLKVVPVVLWRDDV